MSDTAGARCRNCGATLHGPFCSECGQSAREITIPLRRFVSEFAGDALGLDSRLARTLRALVVRPGWIVSEFIAGRRVRFVPPVRMYLAMSVVFFLLSALDPNSSITVRQTGTRDSIAVDSTAGTGLPSRTGSVPRLRPVIPGSRPGWHSGRRTRSRTRTPWPTRFGNASPRSSSSSCRSLRRC